MDVQGLGLCRYLRERRMAEGLTRDELAKKADVSGSTVRDIEAGKFPSYDLMPGLFNALRVPPVYWDHIMDLTQPRFIQKFVGTLPTVPFPLDLVDLYSHRYPAALLTQPDQELIAVTPEYEEAFPGLKAGGNGLEWMWTDPRAAIVIPDLVRNRHLSTFALRTMGQGIVDDFVLNRIYQTCRTNPDFEKTWNTEVAPEDFYRETLVLRDFKTGREREMIFKTERPEIPLRRWYMWRLVPIPGR